SADKAEGQSGQTNFIFTITRSGDLPADQFLDFAVSGGTGFAANGADFVNGVFPSGSIHFNAGDTGANLTLFVQGDATVEPDENFLITISNATLGGTITQATATGVIRNDDGAEIGVTGNGQNIVVGDTTPSNTDDTDFGTVTIGSPAVTHVFTVSNS